MRIALVSQQYPPETASGGIGTQAYLKAHGLAALGHDVTVVSFSSNGERRESRDAAVRIVRVPEFDRRLYLRTEIAWWVTYSAQVAAEVAGLHAAEPLDVVDFPEHACEGYVHLLNQGTDGERIPTVVQLHGPLAMLAHRIGWPEIESDFYRLGAEMEKTCLCLADGLYSSSALSADWCAEQYGITRERIAVAHMGVDTERFQPLALDKNSRPTIVFVGRIARSKGVDTLVEAACELARSKIVDLRLRLIGNGDDALCSELKERAKAAGRPELLSFAGYVSGQDLPHELAQAHVFAAPSMYEGGPGLVYLEAMACGLPVVACRGSGAEEVVADGETGVLVPPRDAAALSKALRYLLENPDRRADLGERARRWVLSEADSETCARRLAELYESVLEGAGR